MTEDIDEIEGNWYNSFNKINHNLAKLNYDLSR